MFRYYIWMRSPILICGLLSFMLRLRILISKMSRKYSFSVYSIKTKRLLVKDVKYIDDPTFAMFYIFISLSLL